MCIAVARTGAAQAVKPTPGLEGWGEPVDPDGDCQLKLEGAKLTIKLPPRAHDLSAELNLVNAPRVWREIEGQFTAMVTVNGPIRPKAESTLEGRPPFQGAGLLVWQDRDNYLRLDRAAYVGNDGLLVHYVNFELRKDGQIASQTSKLVLQLPIHLMLERHGDRIHPAFGYDGKHWTRFRPMEAGFKRGLKVGVAAMNTAGEPFVAVLDELAVLLEEPEAGEP